MCGIAGVYLKNPDIVVTENDQLQFDRFIDELLLGIENRGRDATGFVATRGTRIQMDKKNVPASDFIKTRRRAWLPNGTRAVLCHTRLATQGDPKDLQNNHPVMYGNTFVIHNGHIRNDSDVFDDLKLERYAAVDTSAIAAAVHHHGFDDLKGALERLQGGFAVGVIDPVRNPDELYLVKGPTMPLHYYESAHMLVWASTSLALTQAWETVLGTPPRPNAIKMLAEGSVLHVKDGEVELKKDFFKPKSSGTWGGYTGSSTHGSTTAGSSYTWRSRGTSTVLNMKARTAAYRASGKGRAITWDHRKDMTTAQLAMHNNKWKTCNHCEEMIADCFMIHSIEWGEICVDCLALASADRRTEMDNKGAKWAQMDNHDFDQLAEYAEFDMETINEAVGIAADRIGFPRDLVFWILFCSDWTNLSSGVEELKERVYEVYLMAENEVMEGVTGTFLESDGRQETDPWLDYDPTEEPEETVCEVPLLTAGEQPKMGGCDHCRRKAKIVLDGARWCNKHYKCCHEKGCGDDPVGTTPDGKRWCHSHSRGRKGLKYPKKVTVGL